MVDINYCLDKMSNDQERKPLGPSVRDFLEYVYWGKTHPVCGQLHAMGLDPRPIKKTKSIEHQHFSVP